MAIVRDDNYARLGQGGIPRGRQAENIVGTMAVTEPGDIMTMSGIVGIVAGGDGVMWSIMQGIMRNIMRSVAQSDETDIPITRLRKFWNKWRR